MSPADPTSSCRTCCLLDLPGDILSQISSYLPLPELFAFLSLHPRLLTLCKTHLTPLPQAIRQVVNEGSPYPPILAALPSLRLFLPDDGGRMFIDVLVKCPPRWILERFEMGRWRDTIWKESFERRFLPSWKRYKKEEDTWRAVFLRSQNNFATQPTEVRAVLHLQDVRIIALGVLWDKPSLFVNKNAHLLLHPPLLRHQKEDWTWSISRPGKSTKPESTVPGGSSFVDPMQGIGAVHSPSLFPMIVQDTQRSYAIPNSEAYNLSISPASATPFSNLRPRIRRFSIGNERKFGRRASDTGRHPWVFGRDRSASSSSALVGPTMSRQPQSESSFTGDFLSSQEGNSTPSSLIQPSRPSFRPSLLSQNPNLMPFMPILHPQPASSHALYPNYTPFPFHPNRPLSDLPEERSDEAIIDRRILHPEVEDDANHFHGLRDGVLEEENDWNEWDPIARVRKRWVGPMLLVAQLHPCGRKVARPIGARETSDVEGNNVDLGPDGMYVSLGFEDLNAIMGWVELKGGGGNNAEALRNGLGFG
ncbi:hypothetical protein TREMEDRAFT_73318 [Tremella mesenterica DSM 1558]|uniref:uncharacterized protein n=1 Tax=Tremella mesenterica (strain ATCC 24925 / CBS 8224 / DSM 1558 / NBRC 9311 / NRRL Y-6157 / RJB 2259-6 / UBC 559-6) TaxID=578456 RepID=UPI0003F48DA2|nr:uncharacterized protein TREMEDRAFT_73318 [Tremella mesenterica DSM 1558]EIW71472.1 hypothetical protein TREMEDRAFT_73318 [Tremella mesenterica DSM 1558]